jgi:prevent-host-death family protein
MQTHRLCDTCLDGIPADSSSASSDREPPIGPASAWARDRGSAGVTSAEALFMAEKTSESPVRIIGSRELHQNLPGILRELENDKVRYVLTVHGKPRAVLIGAEPYLGMILEGKRSSEALVGLQLTALLGGDLGAVALDDLERALDGRSD